ncbi:MAG: hypothetical protein M3R25_12355 [Bacteroidota bacterium]|nr:hypothetical protein [Bacteroidota bacterium]
MSLPTPYSQESYNKIYNLLFCDDPALFQFDKASPPYPWDILMAPDPLKDQLEKVALDIGVESRLRLLAYKLMKKAGWHDESKNLLGFVIEIGFDDGLDTLAVYKDGTARYINHKESMIVWDTPTIESDNIILNIFKEGQSIVDRIGPWEGSRKGAPAFGMCRLTFLVSGDLYFGEGPFDEFQSDPMAGPVVAAATRMLVFLTDKALGKG